MNILLIQLKRIGDLILTTPAIEALRARFPDAQIVLAASNDVAGLIPAIEHVDRTILMQRNFADATAFVSVGLKRFEFCVDFTRNDRSALLSFLSHAKKRVVSYRVKRRAPIRGRAYNEFVQHRMRDMHTIDYNLSLLGPLGIHDAAPDLHLHIPDASVSDAKQFLQHSGIDKPFAVFHPGSARLEKFWEPERWADVILHAIEHHGLSAILTGGTSRMEQAHLGEIKALLPRPTEAGAAHPIVDLSGKMDLLGLAALIAKARLVVTVDSAPVHLAAAAGTPQVALFGPTNPYHWRPRQSPCAIMQGDSPVPQAHFESRQPRVPMKLISTEAVKSAMDALLSSPAA